jgi:hypothetical protein
LTPHAAGSAAQLALPVARAGLRKLFRQRILKGVPVFPARAPSGPPTVTVLGDWPEVLGSEGEWRDGSSLFHVGKAHFSLPAMRETMVIKFRVVR